MPAIILKPWEMQVLAVSAWHDPEFFGPEGMGCARCTEGAPAVWGLKCGALCWGCLAGCFHGWGEERLITWLGRQREVAIRQEERKAVFRLWYGVWLLDVAHPTEVANATQ